MLENPFTMAIARAVAGAVVLGIGAFLHGWNPDDVLTTNNAIKAGLEVAVGYLVLRGGFEGGFDQLRAYSGKSLPSDVPNTIRRLGTHK